MTTADTQRIFIKLHALLMMYSPPCQPHMQTSNGYDLWTPAKTIAGQPVDEQLFASVISQAEYVALYCIPAYARVESAQKLIPPRLRPLYVGNGCFRISEWDDELAQAVSTLVKRGFAVYRARGWV